jgi:hypothetical protein
MKKQLLFFAILIGLPSLSFAQKYQYVPFPNSGAVWSEVYYQAREEGEPSKSIYERFTISGEDTVISETTYKKLYIFYDSIFNKDNATCIGGIREDSLKRIYYFGDALHFLKPLYANKEILLFDFSLEIGDTIWGDRHTNVYGRLIVEDIDTIQIGNTLRKKFYFNYLWVEWTEGIGSNSGILFAASDIPTGSSYPSNTLVCFLQNTTVLYQSIYFEDCFPTLTGIETYKTDSDMKVYPNPVTGTSIRLEWGNSTIETIELFNYRGALIGTFNVAGETMLEYPAGKMQSGIYFYRATNSGGMKQTRKFTIE